MEDNKDKGMLEHLFKDRVKEMEGKPFRERYANHLKMLPYIIAFVVFVIIWNIFFPMGIF